MSQIIKYLFLSCAPAKQNINKFGDPVSWLKILTNINVIINYNTGLGDSPVEKH
jgi:hypothetical protein